MKVFHMPQGGRSVDAAGRFVPAWLNYLLGVSEVSKRVAAKVDPLPDGASTATVSAKVNELIAALKDAGLMET